MTNIAATEAAPEWREYTQEEKRAWSKKKASENAAYLSEFLGYSVSDRLPFVLLQAARSVCESIQSGRRLIRAFRADHRLNAARVLACAILHYDLAANLVATRDANGKLSRCDNTLFADKLNLPRRTVDNAIYTLKRSGLYLSFERREQVESGERRGGWRGLASIKRLNMAIFELLGLGHMASVQRNKAKQRAEIKKMRRTDEERVLDDYRRTDDKLREKRNLQRQKGAMSRTFQPSRTQAQLEALERGESYESLKQAYADPADDIPY